MNDEESKPALPKAPSATELHLEAYRNFASNIAHAWFTMKMQDREEMERMGREILDAMYAEILRDMLRTKLYQLPLKDVATAAGRSLGQGRRPDKRRCRSGGPHR